MKTGWIQYKIPLQNYKNKKKKFILKYYFTDEVIEEIENNLPNDLLIHIKNNYSPENIEDLLLYVYEALKAQGENTDNTQFPFSFNFSIINKWVVEKEKVFNQEYSIDNKYCLSYPPYFLEYNGYCLDIQQLNALLELIISEEKNYYSGFFFTSVSERIEGQFREGSIYGNKIIAILRGELLVSASPIEMISGQLCIVKDEERVSPEYMQNF